MSDNYSDKPPRYDGAGCDLPLPSIDEAIADAHPTKSKRPDLYNEAEWLVGAKQSKVARIDLVNWLLVKIDNQKKEIEGQLRANHDEVAFHRKRYRKEKARAERAEATLDTLHKAATDLRNGMTDHYVNAEDLYALDCALASLTKEEK